MVAAVAPADAPSAAQQIVAQELHVDDVVSSGALEITSSDCAVQVHTNDVDGAVSFSATADGMVPVYFRLGVDTALSLSVRGRHVTAGYECGGCASVEMHVRYGDTLANVAPQPDGLMEVDLAADPAVPGRYVFVARAADGAILHALANTIPAGDFAAG